MAEGDARDVSLNSYALASSRWLLYLLLGMLGAIFAGAVVTLIASFAILADEGPYAFGWSMTIGLGFSLIVLPLYTLAGVGVGLLSAKGHAIRSQRVKLLSDGPLVECVHRLARRTGLPRPPDVGVYPSPDMNAFTTGSSRSNAIVAFTNTLLENCPEEEVEAVAAHEIGHIASGDVLALVTINSVQNAMSWYMGLRQLRQFVRSTLLFIGEMAANALSRSREYRADAIAAVLVGPQPMIAALQRLGGHKVPIPADHMPYARHSIRHAAGSTHPTIENRIHALERGAYTHTSPLSRKPEGSEGTAPVEETYFLG